MNYKQKYENALKIAEEIYRSYPLSGTTKAVCEKIFPKLKENKDEKAREYLIKCVKEWESGHCLWNSDKETCQKLLAWLEKQGEQKSTEWSNEDIAMIDSIIASMKCGYKSSIGQEKWLKSLKQRMKGE